MTHEVGLRELRQRASELVRLAQAGESLTVTVSGRPAATLGPIRPGRWSRWNEIADVFSHPVDPGLAADLTTVGDVLRDPWNPA